MRSPYVSDTNDSASSDLEMSSAVASGDASLPKRESILSEADDTETEQTKELLRDEIQSDRDSERDGQGATI